MDFVSYCVPCAKKHGFGLELNNVVRDIMRVIRKTLVRSSADYQMIEAEIRKLLHQQSRPKGGDGKDAVGD